MTLFSPHVLVVDDDVADLLVFRSILRETPYLVRAVRSGRQALAALEQQQFAAVVADDERLPDMSGVALLGEVEGRNPQALRILIARSERTAALYDAARSRRYQLIARPFFARPLVASLVEHYRNLISLRHGEDTQRMLNPFIEVEAEEDQTAPLADPSRTARRQLLLTLAEVVEAKVGNSPGHGARVSALAAVLAREVGVGSEEACAIEDAALVHDIGELRLDAELLAQPCTLSLVEHRIIQAHAESSQQIARRAGLSEEILSAVRHHHERFDGRGYPDGLGGPSIPLAARITAVADTWDALATERPHRPARPVGDCVRELGAGAGSQLDPELVATYLDKRLYELIDWSDPPRPGALLL